MGPSTNLDLKTQQESLCFKRLRIDTENIKTYTYTLDRLIKHFVIHFRYIL